MDEILFKKASEIIKNAGRITAFTGAGISVESGIPPFRGENGLWNKYDPNALDINHFYANPQKAWSVIQAIFYEFLGNAQPNLAHLALAELETHGKLHSIITQNIDNMHQAAGSKNVIEYHGNSHRLVCLRCSSSYSINDYDMAKVPPLCKKCGSILKPDFVFFGEPIPSKAFEKARLETVLADVWIIIGTTGEVYPAASLPFEAKMNAKTIIEINIEPSAFTNQITDILLTGKATEITSRLKEYVLA